MVTYDTGEWMAPLRRGRGGGACFHSVAAGTQTWPAQPIAFIFAEERAFKGLSSADAKFRVGFWGVIAPESNHQAVHLWHSFAEACLGHEDPPQPLCWPTASVSPSVAGRGTNTLRIHTAIVFSAECKHSATAERPAALHERKQQCGPDFTGYAWCLRGGAAAAQAAIACVISVRIPHALCYAVPLLQQ